jgi:hypothetical protein
VLVHSELPPNGPAPCSSDWKSPAKFMPLLLPTIVAVYVATSFMMLPLPSVLL